MRLPSQQHAAVLEPEVDDHREARPEKRLAPFRSAVRLGSPQHRAPPCASACGEYC